METFGGRENHLACYNSTSDTLIFSEEIVNLLETVRTDSKSQLWNTFEFEMDKIQESGDLSNTSSVKLDEYLGTIGLIDTTVIKRKGALDGLCK